MFWLINALKAGKIKSVGQAIKAFTNVNGRAPSGVERLRIGQIFENTKAKVLPFRYKKSFKQEIDEMSKPAPTVGGKTIEEVLGGISWADRKKAEKVIEKYTLINNHTMKYEATIEDEKVFTKPWKISMNLYKRVGKDAQLQQFKCVEFVEELFYGQWRGN